MWEELVIYQRAKSTVRFYLYSGKPKNNPPLSADLWSMKAMFEDYFGDSLTAQKNYRSADSAYAILIKEYATDSLKYASFRINRALNMALMTDNIAVLKEEVELAKKIFPETWKGLDTNVYGKNKKDFFDKCFNVRKK